MREYEEYDNYTYWLACAGQLGTLRNVWMFFLSPSPLLVSSSPVIRVKVKVVACPHSLRSACQQVQDPIICCRPVLSPRSLSFIMSLEGTRIIIKKTFSKTAAMKQKNLSMSKVRKGWMQVESSRDGMHKHNAGNNASWKSEGVLPIIRDGDWLEYKTLFLKWCSQGESLLFSD